MDTKTNTRRALTYCRVASAYRSVQGILRKAQALLLSSTGAFIYCSMSTWDGSAGAPLFKTGEKSGTPQLVGIFNFTQKNTKRGVAEDESDTNVFCNISHIKKHVDSGEWNKKGQTSCSALVLEHAVCPKACTSHLDTLLLHVEMTCPASSYLLYIRRYSSTLESGEAPLKTDWWTDQKVVGWYYYLVCSLSGS